MDKNLAEKSRAYRYICEKCHFKCNDKRDYERHLGTAKHRRIKMDKNDIIISYDCDCGKKYNYQSGLCKHKKKCTYKPPEEILKNEMKEILKEQQEEQRKLLIEQQEQHKQQIEVLTEKIS